MFPTSTGLENYKRQLYIHHFKVGGDHIVVVVMGDIVIAVEKRDNRITEVSPDLPKIVQLLHE